MGIGKLAVVAQKLVKPLSPAAKCQQVHRQGQQLAGALVAASQKVVRVENANPLVQVIQGGTDQPRLIIQ